MSCVVWVCVNKEIRVNLVPHQIISIGWEGKVHHQQHHLRLRLRLISSILTLAEVRGDGGCLRGDPSLYPGNNDSHKPPPSPPMLPHSPGYDYSQCSDQSSHMSSPRTSISISSAPPQLMPCYACVDSQAALIRSVNSIQKRSQHLSLYQGQHAVPV